MKNILFLTNGHGEDQVAARLIRVLDGCLPATRLSSSKSGRQVSSSKISISVFPLVGEGNDFKNLNVKLLGPLKALPSGGFSLRNFLSLPIDLASGLFSLFTSQIKTLKGLKNRFDLTVAIGDIVPIVGAIIVGSPFVCVGVNKSSYYTSFGYNYTPWEKWLLKKYAKAVYARDAITAETLKKDGINASYLGNPLMEGLERMSNALTPYPRSLPAGRQVPKGEGGHIIGFLPGTRKADIQKNMDDFKCIEAELLKLDKHFKFLYALKENKNFEDVIYNSDVIVGLSGTGNEQAAGIGKPVVAFVGRGAQYNKKFAYAQKELLGEALALVDHNPRRVAEEVWDILNDMGRAEYMAKTGKTRMGKGGAIEKINQEITNLLK